MFCTCGTSLRLGAGLIYSTLFVALSTILLSQVSLPCIIPLIADCYKVCVSVFSLICVIIMTAQSCRRIESTANSLSSVTKLLCITGSIFCSLLTTGFSLVCPRLSCSTYKCSTQSSAECFTLGTSANHGLSKTTKTTVLTGKCSCYTNKSTSNTSCNFSFCPTYRWPVTTATATAYHHNRRTSHCIEIRLNGFDDQYFVHQDSPLKKPSK